LVFTAAALRSVNDAVNALLAHSVGCWHHDNESEYILFLPDFVIDSASIIRPTFKYTRGHCFRASLLTAKSCMPNFPTLWSRLKIHHW